jgi:carbonic anhydrase/acetyltransferase-like protein (isoleucine patch superfamily)
MPYEAASLDMSVYAEVIRPAERLRTQWLLQLLGVPDRGDASSQAIAKSHPALFRLGRARPRIADRVFLAAGATVVGNVTIGRASSIWFGAVLRGDNGPIRIGDGSNIQDGAIVHSHPEGEVTLGSHVSVGHHSVVHGCTIGDRVLIGMQVCIMDGAIISEDSIVAAGSLITRDKKYPPGVLIQGTPARVVRALSASDLHYIRRNALEYVERGHRYATELTPA